VIRGEVGEQEEGVKGYLETGGAAPRAHVACRDRGAREERSDSTTSRRAASCNKFSCSSSLSPATAPGDSHLHLPTDIESSLGVKKSLLFISTVTFVFQLNTQHTHSMVLRTNPGNATKGAVAALNSWIHDGF
jgi:hypothetical protein